jgi:hypothetical protein
MQQVKKLLIVSALGFGLTGCSLWSSPPVQKIEVSTTPVEKPKLVLPKADQLFQRPIEWVLITPENVEEAFKAIQGRGRPVLLFGVTDKGYENLALNLSDLRAYLQQQKTIIAAYENYYQQSNKAIEEANRRLDKAEEDANKAPPEAPVRPWEIWKND